MSWRELAPEPSALWARWIPRDWLPLDEGRADPFGDAIGSSVLQSSTALPAVAPSEPEVTYLPPVPFESRAARDRLAAAIVESGGHALVHIDLDEERPVGFGETHVVDLLGPLLMEARGEPWPDSFGGVRGAWVVLPLLPGVPTSGIEGWRRWLARLTAAGAAGAAPVTTSWSARERRLLAASAPESRWDAFFHAVPPSDSELAREIASAGLAALAARPEVGAPPRRSRNRRLASILLATATLGDWLGESEAVAAELRAAARRIEASPLDVEALAREGNLGVLDWLGDEATALLAEAVRKGRSARLAELEARLREPARPA
jgi:hypothetical protein